MTKTKIIVALETETNDWIHEIVEKTGMTKVRIIENAISRMRFEYDSTGGDVNALVSARPMVTK